MFIPGFDKNKEAERLRQEREAEELRRNVVVREEAEKDQAMAEYRRQMDELRARTAATDTAKQQADLAARNRRAELDQQAQIGRGQQEATARQQREQDERRQKFFLEQSRGINGGAPGSGAAPSTGAAPGMQPPVQDARAAAFARAKDQAGKLARASLTSVAENVASRGISGSGIEALRSANAIGGAEESLQDLNTAQLMSDENRASNIDDRNYAGDLAKRGQDLNARQSYLSLLRGLY